MDRSRCQRRGQNQRDRVDAAALRMLQRRRGCGEAAARRWGRQRQGREQRTHPSLHRVPGGPRACGEAAARRWDRQGPGHERRRHPSPPILDHPLRFHILI